MFGTSLVGVRKSEFEKERWLGCRYGEEAVSWCESAQFEKNRSELSVSGLALLSSNFVLLINEPMLSLTQVWGALLILLMCPLLGALPLTGWLTGALGGGELRQGSGGNAGVSAAFETGGTIAGLLAIVIEAAKGIVAVLLARHYFPADPAWEIIALIALVMGRYWGAKAVGTTSVLWGAIVHSPVTAGLTLLISFLGFTIFRERQQGRLLVLVLFPLMTALNQAGGMQVLLTACLCGLVGWIYQKVPEDLEVPTAATRLESQRLFGFFRSDRALRSLDQLLSKDIVGGKAAILSQLKAWGYPVPPGYVLPAGDDPTMLIEITRPSVQATVVVRASVVGDNPAIASSAGQYAAVLDVKSQDALFAAINQVFRAYDRGSAVQYRRDHDLTEGSLAVIVQQQVEGLCSGVAFSRDPFTGEGEAVIIEAVLGKAQAVTGGQQRPERYRVMVQADDVSDQLDSSDSWRIPDALTLEVEGTGDVPNRLLAQVAFLVRHLEKRYRGIPQNIEWSFDGDRLWLLQSRPIIPLQNRQIVDYKLALPGTAQPTNTLSTGGARLVGVPICPGEVIGKVVILREVPDPRSISPEVILVVPYLKATEIPGLAKVLGLIAETGGQLSNGAIAAREYGIPTIVLPAEGGDRLVVGHRVRLNGALGSLELM